MLAQGVSLCPGPSPHPVALFSLGSRPVSSPLPGIFSLPGVLCFILGSLLLLVLVILVTQVFRWRAERRGGLQGELGTRESVWRQEMGQVLGGEPGPGLSCESEELHALCAEL